VADIKRVNNLIREQDFYALKSIRIPVKKHGLFTECSAELGEAPPCASRAPCPLPSPSPPPAAHSAASPDARECTDFLREVDQDLERLIQTSDGLGPCPADDHGGPPRAAGRQAPASYGADWGIRWWNAVLVMLLIGIILPIFYLVYYKTQESVRTAVDAGFVNHSDPTSNTTEKSLGTTPSEGLDVQGRTHPLLRKMTPKAGLLHNFQA
uniref:LysM, putative peptidoglycan-binding, domain containing 4 n=1 Tax=Lepisosteus oculatus TaxID=7918 RepID=W5NAR1_LEPOC